MNDVSTIELAYKEITDSITDCIFSIDNSFNFTYCNKASEDYSGKKRSEILGFNYFQIFPFHSTTVFKNKFKYALDNQKAVSFLYETNFNGKELLNVSVYPSTSGLTLLIKSSRESLFLGLPREELFQDTLNNMLEGCAVIDYNWCYLYMNDTYASQVSVSKSTSIGKKITDVIKEIEKSIFFEAFKESMNERKPKQVEDCLVFPDGSKKWFTIRTIPVPDGIFIHSNEFTKRKKYEEDLLRYQSVLNQAEKMAHLGSWWINIDNLNDINSNKLGWSDEVFRIFGFEPNSVEVTNDLFFSLVHPDDRQRIVEQFSTSLSNKKPYSIEHRIIRPDGTERIVFEHAEFSLDKNGDVNCVLGAVQDITESKKAVKYLEYSLHEKENLLRELFHRTKNNMQVISSLLTLKAAEVNDQRTTGVLEDMNNRILAISLVHQKLYQSKNLSRVNIKDYITDLVELLKSSHLIRTQKIEFRLNIEEVNILFDTAVPCGLIINELISNSLKYAFPRNRKGCIEVSFTRNENDLLELTISDNGIGIHEDVSEDRYNLGLRLFHIIAEDQLQAEVSLDNSKGISWTIRFKDILYHERV